MSVKTQGSTLQLSDGASPEVFTDIASITSFQGPSGSRQVIDATVLASTAKVKDVGIPDYGQVTFDFNFDASDTVLVDVWDNFIAGTLHSFWLVFSDSGPTVFEFSAYVLNFSYAVAMDDIVRGSVTLEISGAVTVDRNSGG